MPAVYYFMGITIYNFEIILQLSVLQKDFVNKMYCTWFYYRNAMHMILL